MSATDPKMAQFLDRLTHREQQIICHQVRSHSGEQRYAHLAPHLLPFVSLSVVRSVLLKSNTPRPVAQIKAKLGQGFVDASTRMVLTDKKVIRLFGLHPELGRTITWLPGKPIVALKRCHNGTGFGMWEIQVDGRHRAAIMDWVFDRCGG